MCSAFVYMHFEVYFSNAVDRTSPISHAEHTQPSHLPDRLCSVFRSQSLDSFHPNPPVSHHLLTYSVSSYHQNEPIIRKRFTYTNLKYAHKTDVWIIDLRLSIRWWETMRKICGIMKVDWSPQRCFGEVYGIIGSSYVRLTCMNCHSKRCIQLTKHHMSHLRALYFASSLFSIHIPIQWAAHTTAVPTSGNNITSTSQPISWNETVDELTSFTYLLPQTKKYVTDRKTVAVMWNIWFFEKRRKKIFFTVERISNKEN